MAAVHHQSDMVSVEGMVSGRFCLRPCHPGFRFGHGFDIGAHEHDQVDGKEKEAKECHSYHCCPDGVFTWVVQQRYDEKRSEGKS